MSELHASCLGWRAPAGLWCLCGLGRRIADWRSNGFDRVWCWTWVRSRVGFGRIRRRRLDWLGTVSVFWEGKRGSGSVFRHVGDPRFCVPLNRSKGYAGVGVSWAAVFCLRRLWLLLVLLAFPYSRFFGLCLSCLPSRRLFLYACGGGLCLIWLPSRRLFVCVPTALAFPCILSGLLAFPLCGGAPTFLCLLQRKATVLEVKR